MKKIMSLFVAVLALILVTGCGSSKNTVTCTQDEDGMTVTVKATTDNNDKIKKVNMSMTAEAENEADAKAGAASYETLKAAYEGQDGMKIDVKRDGLKVTISFDIDLSKVSADALEKFNMSDMVGKDLTGAAFKKNAQDSGATCK